MTMCFTEYIRCALATVAMLLLDFAQQNSFILHRSLFNWKTINSKNSWKGNNSYLKICQLVTGHIFSNPQIIRKKWVRTLSCILHRGGSGEKNGRIGPDSGTFRSDRPVHYWRLHLKSKLKLHQEIALCISLLLNQNCIKWYEVSKCVYFGSTYTKIGTIQRRLAWPLRKDDTQNREAFHIFCPH